MLQIFNVTCFVLIAFGCLLITIVFCFWFVYLLDAITRKWKFYKNALRCLQQENFDSQQQILVYNAKTEFVKNVFLFFMNFIEWLALIFICVENTIDIIPVFANCENANTTNNITHSSRNKLNSDCTSIPFLDPIFMTLENNCAVLSLVLIASLCKYLASRFYQCSWITSDNIPYLISLCILYQVVSQIIATFSSFFILIEFFNLFLLTVSTLFALKQYRKLLMVINWTIVDLRVSGNNFLLKKQIRMKRTFTRIFASIWVGISLVLIYHYLLFCLIICGIISYFLSPEIGKISSILNGVIQIPLAIGLVVIYTPYVGYGLSTMFVVLRRLYTGKSAYRTHFHNPLYAS